MKYLLMLIFCSIWTQIFPDQVQVITITQTACQFLEVEGQNLNFKSKEESDCAKINSATLNTRKKNFKTLKLKSGEYNFKVTNKNVPYEIGFFLRGVGLGRLTLPSTSGGELYTGVTKDYRINLKPGTYKMSCPLNSTPDYDLIVEE